MVQIKIVDSIAVHNLRNTAPLLKISKDAQLVLLNNGPLKFKCNKTMKLKESQNCFRLK